MKKAIGLLLVIVILLGVIPVSVFAEDVPDNVIELESIAAPEPSSITVAPGQAVDKLSLPQTLLGTYTADEQTAEASVAVNWTSDSEQPYDSATAGSYLFHAAIADANYSYAGMMPSITVVVAEDEPPTQSGAPVPKIITAFATLLEDTVRIMVEPGTQVEALPLPAALNATVDGAETTVEGVVWACDGYTPDTAGEYIFTAVLPQGYVLAEENQPELPKITVVVVLPRPTRVAPSSGKFLAPITPIQELPDFAEYIPVSNRAELEAIADNLTGKYYLTNDIDLGGVEWVPIGGNYGPFAGIFDGQGHIISNMKITGDYQYAGLFGATADEGIKNVGMEDASINVSGSGNVGSIAGMGDVSNCFNTGDIYCASTSIYSDVGGIIGNGTALKCYNTGDITLSSSDHASIVYAGGITGYGNASGCYNTGNIGAISTDSLAHAGGIVGCMSLVDGYVLNCYNTGNVSVSTAGSAGGIAGDMGNSGYISNCYNAGVVSITNNSRDNDYSGAGGIAGGGAASGIGNNGVLTITSPCVVTNCASLGAAINHSGAYQSASALIFCINVTDKTGRYNLARDDTDGNPNNDATKLLPLNQFYLQVTFESIGWDFENVWEMVDGQNFPQLKKDTIYVGDDEDSGQPKRYSIAFHTGLAGYGSPNFINMDIVWGWNLFNKSSAHYDNNLAIAGCALSSATESTFTSAESMLRTLGFDDVDSDYYDGWINFAQPAVTFGHKKINIAGNDTNVFAVAIRGTSDPGDIVTDLSSVAGGFYAAKNTIKSRLETYMMSVSGMTLDQLKSENIKFFITGHSYGGAVANLLSVELSEYAGASDTYVYTFASPRTTYGDSARLGVHNILNSEDMVPVIWSAQTGRYGNNIWFNRKDIQRMDTTFAVLSTGKVLDHYIDGNWYEIEWDRVWRPHNNTVYMAYLLARGEVPEIWRYQIRVASFKCPVDIEVYNESGELVGRVANNVVDTSIPMGVFIEVIGDEKYVYMPFDGQYTFKILSTGEGSMDYESYMLDIESGEKTSSKLFNDVALYAGKQMFSNVGGDIEVPDTMLYVTDENGAKEAEVHEDGTETPTTNDDGDASDDNTTAYVVTMHPDTWGGIGSASWTIEAPFNKFLRLMLSGGEVPANNYNKSEGSTIITLNESYIKTLATGRHIFRAVFTDGYADLILTVQHPHPMSVSETLVVSQAASPQTGDASNTAGWVIVLSMSAIGLLSLFTWYKRYFSKRAR